MNALLQPHNSVTRDTRRQPRLYPTLKL